MRLQQKLANLKMTNLRKNSLGLIVMAAAVLLLGLFGFYVQKTNAAPDAVMSEASATATTSPAYLAIGGSTIFQFDSNTVPSNKIQSMQSVTATSLYFQYAASSTSSVLNVTPQYSNNNIDWYGFNQIIGTENGTTGSTSLASTSLSYTFTAVGIATSSQVILLPVVPALHERVVFTQTGAAGAVYSETDLKSQTQ